MIRSRFWIGDKKARVDESIVRYRHWAGSWETIKYNTPEAAHEGYKRIAVHMDAGDLCAPLQVELTIT